MGNGKGKILYIELFLKNDFKKKTYIAFAPNYELVSEVATIYLKIIVNRKFMDKAENFEREFFCGQTKLNFLGVGADVNYFWNELKLRKIEKVAYFFDKLQKYNVLCLQNRVVNRLHTFHATIQIILKLR